MMTFWQRVVWLWRYWRPHPRFLLLLVLLTFLSAAVSIAYPLVFKTIIDSMRSNSEPAFDLGEILWILAGLALAQVLARLYPGFRAWMNCNLQNAIRQHVFSAITEKDYRFFTTFRTGDLVTRLTDDVEDYPKLGWFACSGLFRALESSVILIFCVVTMLLLNWPLALLSLLPVPVLAFWLYRLLGSLRLAFLEQQAAISETNNMLEATFAGIRIVKAFCSEGGQAQRFEELLARRIGIQLRVQTLLGMLHAGYVFVSRAGQVVVLAAGGLMYLQGTTTLGTIYAFYILLDILVRPMFDLPNLVVSSRQAVVCMDREEEVLSFPVEQRWSGEQSVDSIESIELVDVSVSYDQKSKALEGLNCHFRRGEHVALVGEVASGKSTLLETLAGLLQPIEGKIMINGEPAQRMSFEGYRKRVGYVPQESLLFSETIAENVVIGRAEVAHRLDEALGVAQMESELKAMSLGVETRLGQHGSLISGGQRQRVAIARAVAGQPDVYLLDDCTANLDAESEALFWSALGRYSPEATVISVSHRLSTIMRAERVIMMVRGRIVDQGKHEELAERCAEYREFLMRGSLAALS